MVLAVRWWIHTLPPSPIEWVFATFHLHPRSSASNSVTRLKLETLSKTWPCQVANPEEQFPSRPLTCNWTSEEWHFSFDKSFTWSQAAHSPWLHRRSQVWWAGVSWHFRRDLGIGCWTIHSSKAPLNRMHPMEPASLERSCQSEKVLEWVVGHLVSWKTFENCLTVPTNCAFSTHWAKGVHSPAWTAGQCARKELAESQYHGNHVTFTSPNESSLAQQNWMVEIQNLGLHWARVLNQRLEASAMLQKICCVPCTNWLDQKRPWTETSLAQRSHFVFKRPDFRRYEFLRNRPVAIKPLHLPRFFQAQVVIQCALSFLMLRSHSTSQWWVPGASNHGKHHNSNGLSSWSSSVDCLRILGYFWCMSCLKYRNRPEAIFPQMHEHIPRETHRCEQKRQSATTAARKSFKMIQQSSLEN